MSLKLLREEIRQLEELLEEVLRENSQLERENEAMEKKILAQSPPRRHRSYPRDHPRDPSGRIIGTCLRCGNIGTIIAHGLCRKCYDAHRQPGRPLLGSMPPRLCL